MIGLVGGLVLLCVGWMELNNSYLFETLISFHLGGTRYPRRHPGCREVRVSHSAQSALWAARPINQIDPRMRGFTSPAITFFFSNFDESRKIGTPFKFPEESDVRRPPTHISWRELQISCCFRLGS